MIETPRFLLRQPRLSDAPALFEFLGDAEAMRLTHVDASLKECRQRIAIHERQRRRHGYAPWTIFLKNNGRLIGWGGLYDDPFDPGWGVELGYYFHPDTWGQGYGSEFVSAALNEADETLKLPKIRAFARAENKASRKLLENADFKAIRFLPEMERLLFERDRKST